MQRRDFFAAAVCSTWGTAAWGLDALDRPARTSALADQRLITGIARAGVRLVAVGQRGHVVYSSDGGQRWKQASVPVSSDLTAVAFANADAGYATGHDGIVIGTRDGGRHWARLLDGRQVNALVLDHMKRRTLAPDATDHDRRLLEEARRNVDAGPDKPFLDLCFHDASHGWVVGAYGLVMRTTDGGGTWESWIDRSENPRLLNLYSVCASRGALYVAGESGLLLKLDLQARPDAQRFRALASPYQGSFFGTLATPAGVLAYGMRGNAFLSPDAGTTWVRVDTDTDASIVGGALGPDGTVALADQAGHISLSGDGGRSFQRSGLRHNTPLTSLVFSGRASIVVAGQRGLRTLQLPSRKKDSTSHGNLS